MRKLFFALCLLALPLAGCAGGSATGSLPSPTQVQDTITQIQAITTQVCKFAPTAATVANIIDALGLHGAGAVGDIANQICSAVTKVGATRHGGSPKVAGVRIRGKFVR